MKHRKAIVLGATALSLIALLAAAFWITPHMLRTPRGEPPLNFVKIDEKLATAGQPSASQLAWLKEQGYEVVINLAPPDAYGTVNEEAYTVGKAGMVYINIPVDWYEPSERDFADFSRLLDLYKNRKVLVHCQMNFRASVFTFLHRVLHEGAPPNRAAEAVYEVWLPHEHWRRFARQVLRARAIDFEI